VASSRQEPNAGKRRIKPVRELHGENITQAAKIRLEDTFGKPKVSARIGNRHIARNLLADCIRINKWSFQEFAACNF
jgi:hypothetical protein